MHPMVEELNSYFISNGSGIFLNKLVLNVYPDCSRISFSLSVKERRSNMPQAVSSLVGLMGPRILIKRAWEMLYFSIACLLDRRPDFISS